MLDIQTHEETVPISHSGDGQGPWRVMQCDVCQAFLHDGDQILVDRTTQNMIMAARHRVCSIPDDYDVPLPIPQPD